MVGIFRLIFGELIGIGYLHQLGYKWEANQHSRGNLLAHPLALVLLVLQIRLLKLRFSEKATKI